jgi:Tol biopolymer transport system component
METGEEREFYEVREAAYYLDYLHWSPDGRSILHEYGGLKLIDVQTGDVTLIARQAVRKCGPAWSPDGKTIFYIRRPGEGTGRCIVAHDLDSGQERELHERGIGTKYLGVSPDGRQLAFIGKERKVLNVMPAAGGEPRELLRLESPETFHPSTGLAWTPDGRYILFGKRTWSAGQPHEPDELCRIPTEGGEPQKLLAMNDLHQISVHPDGRRIVFTAGWDWETKVWVMENFLPGFTAAE